MTDERESIEDYSSLIGQIGRAFADVPYPGDDNLIGTPEHVAECDECGGLLKALVGRRWPALLDDGTSSEYISHAMSFFSAAGWQYYLPAYLIRSIKLRRLSSLYFQSYADEPKLIEYHEERVSRLTGDQCNALIAYLLAVLKQDSDSPYMYERNKDAVDHWNENYAKIISKGAR